MMPSLLNAYSEQLPRLVAEESLQAAERMAVGSGSLKKGVGRRIASGWERATDRQRTVMRPKGRAQYMAQMAGVGIAVKSVPRVTDG